VRHDPHLRPVWEDRTGPPARSDQLERWRTVLQAVWSHGKVLPPHGRFTHPGLGRMHYLRVRGVRLRDGLTLVGQVQRMGSGATGPSDWLWTLDHAKCVRTYVAGTVLAQVTASLSSVCKTVGSACAMTIVAHLGMPGSIP